MKFVDVFIIQMAKHSNNPTFMFVVCKAISSSFKSFWMQGFEDFEN